MKERNYNQITVTCDYCGDDITSRTTNYKQLNDELRQDGWQIVKDDDEWLDFCSKHCKDEYFEKGEANGKK